VYIYKWWKIDRWTHQTIFGLVLLGE
jgi:hypothetical protein